MKRYLAKHFLFIFCIIGLFFVLLFTFATEKNISLLANQAIKKYLGEGIALEEINANLSEASIKNLTIKNNKIPSIHARNANLVSGFLGDITITGAQLTLYQNKNGIHLGELETLVSQKAKTSKAKTDLIPDIPRAFRSIHCKDCRINIIEESTGTNAYPALHANFTATYDDHIAIEGTFTDALKHGKIELKGTIDQQKKTAELTANLFPIIFAKGALQPDYFYPPLRQFISGTEGTVSFNSNITIKDNTLDHHSALTLTELNFESKGNIISGATAKLHFQGLPLKSRGKETITIKNINSALPLNNTKIYFTLNNKQLTIPLLTSKWGDGLLKAVNARINLNQLDAIDFPLTVENIALADIIALNKDHFNATGTLSGTLPIKIENGKLLINKGTLSSDSPGTLRYHPPYSEVGKQHQHMELVLSLLKSFEYESINLGLNSDKQGKVLLKLALDGKNPDIEEGRNVKLNVNIEGNLLDLVSRSLELYQLPENLIGK